MPITRSQARALGSKAEPKPKPKPTPFYEEQEIHKIANELEARIRKEFEKQLADARKEMVDAMMKDRSLESGYMTIDITFNGAYDHKRDIVWVTADEEEDEYCHCCHCECWGESREKEHICRCECCGELIKEAPTTVPTPAPAPAPASVCTFPKFKYKQVKAPIPTRQSARLRAKADKRVKELMGIALRDEWLNSLRALLDKCSSVKGEINSYERLYGDIGAATNIYTFLHKSPHTKTMVDRYARLKVTIRDKASELLARCAYIHKHMNSGCSCFSFTAEQRAQIETCIHTFTSECKQLRL